MRILFFGSDEFALPCLEALLGSAHEVVAVVSQPDRPAGRGLNPVPTPVAKTAREHSISLSQPESLDDSGFRRALDDLCWDAGVVVAYGRIIPGWLLNAPTFGFVNVHPSLLPRYRGAAPIQRAIMNGASVTGVSTIRMNDRLDAGGILLHAEEPVYDEDTTGILGDRLSRLAAPVLLRTLEGIEAGEINPVAQEEEKATTAPPISPREGNIDWRDPADRIDRVIRAMNPEPGAYTFFRGRRLKIWSARATDVPPEDEPGTLMNMGKEGFLVNTGTSCIQPVVIQPEGKPRMSAEEFSRGQRFKIGERFSTEPDL